MKTIELIEGYTDKQGVTHKRVTISKRLTGKDLFAINSDPQAALRTQYDALIWRVAITEFGTLSCPVPLAALLDLDSLDRDDIGEAYNQFQLASAEGRTAEFLSDKTTRLAFGFQREGLTYDLVTFGNRLTGRDDVEADKSGLEGSARRCFLIGRQIVQIAQSDGTATIEGSLQQSWFEALDAADIVTLMGAAEIFRQSFRRAGQAVA